DEARERLGENQGSILWDRVDGQADLISISTLVEAADAGDELATSILKKTDYYLGACIANLINALYPKLIVIGGELSIAQTYLLPEINAVVEEQSLQWSHENCEIVIAKHGTDATLMGGVALVHQETIHNLE